MIIDTEAVVLRGRDFSDSSRILTLYTLSHGKLSAIAKGVKRSAARHGLSLEPMSQIRAVLYVKEHRDLQLLSRFEPLEQLGGLLADVDRMAAGLAMVELVGAATPEAEPNEPLFRLLTSALAAVKHATIRPRNALYHFEVHLLSELGFRPSFDRCTSCGRETGGEAAIDQKTFRLGHAGVVCPACIGRHHGLFPVSPEALALLQELQRTDTAEGAVALALGGRLEEEVDAALRRCLHMNIDTLGTLRSRDVFQSLGRMP